MSKQATRAFEALRPDLLSLAYRMLGDVGRAQDLVQEAWLRWHQNTAPVDSPRAFLITVVTRLCLNELGSARARREESRVQLPEPVADEVIGARDAEQISMAFLVLLERLSPPERAVVLLHDVFDYSHDEVAALLQRTPAASRKLLERAKAKLASGRKLAATTRDEHERLLRAFQQAAFAGDVTAMTTLLADDATLFADAGSDDRVVNGVRAIREPLVGAAAIAEFVQRASRASRPSHIRQQDLNGRPALVFSRDGAVFGALLVEIAGGKIRSLYFQADAARLRFVSGGASA